METTTVQEGTTPVQEGTTPVIKTMTSNVSIQHLKEDTDELTFTIKNVNVSLVNALRRTILSDIPTVVFRTTPYEQNQTNIHINTTRLNNEILKQRISCIPIHITDHTIDLTKYVVEMDQKNESDVVQNVTTKDLRIKNTETSKYLSDQETRRIFPADSITKDFILIVRLRPKVSDNIPGEELKFDSKLDIGTAKEDSTFNVSCTCSYAYTPDRIHQPREWTKKAKKLKQNGYTDEDIIDEETNWKLGDAKRIVVQDSFDFVLESVGVFTNKELIERGCDVLIKKCDALLELIDTQKLPIHKANTTAENTYDISLMNEDYTIGKCIEYAMHQFFYKLDNQLSFVGFCKRHPYDSKSVVRVSFKNEGSTPELLSLLFQSVQYVKSVFENITKQL